MEGAPSPPLEWLSVRLEDIIREPKQLVVGYQRGPLVNLSLRLQVGESADLRTLF